MAQAFVTWDGPVTAAEPWSPVWRERSAIPTMLRAERALERMLAARFERQNAAMLGPLIEALAALPEVMFPEAHAIEPIAAAEQVPDELDSIVSRVLDTTIDGDDMIVLRTQQQHLAQQAFLSTMKSVGLGATADRYMMVAHDSVRMLQQNANPLFTGTDATTRKRIGESLARGLRAGDHLDALTKRVQKTMGEGMRWRSRMIAQTETIRAYGLAAENTAKRVGVEQMQWLDGQLGSCPVCASLNNKVKDVDGSYTSLYGTYDAPPAHPGCRCAQRPYFGDEFEPLTPAEAELGIQYSMADTSNLTYVDYAHGVDMLPQVGDHLDLGKTTWTVVKVGPNSLRVVHDVTGRVGSAKFDAIKRVAYVNGQPAAAPSRALGTEELIARMTINGGSTSQVSFAHDALRGMPVNWLRNIERIQFSDMPVGQNGLTIVGQKTIYISDRLVASELRTTLYHEASHIAEKVTGAIPADVKAALRLNFERFAKESMLPVPTSVADAGALPFDIINGRYTIKDARFMGGAHSKSLISTVDDGDWLFKPATSKAYQGTAESVEQSFARAFGLPAPDAHIFTINGQTGSIQKIMDVERAGWTKGMAPTLTQTQLEQIQQHQVIDWLFSQHDTNKGAPLFLKNGDVAMIDKGQAFKFYGQDVLDPLNYNPNKAFEPLMVYQDMWESATAGKVNLEFRAIKPLIERIQAMDDKVFSEWLRPYINDAADAGVIPLGSPAKFVTSIRMRKAALMDDFKAMYTRYGADVDDITSIDSAAWLRLPPTNRPVRAYALSNADEYQAETLAWYFEAPAKLRVIDPDAFAAIDAAFQRGGFDIDLARAIVRDYQTVTHTESTWKKYWDGWTSFLRGDDSKARAVSYYQGSGNRTINEWLRKGASAHSPDASANTKLLDAALGLPSSVLPRDVILFRGVPRGVPAAQKWKVGGIMQDPGFLSTSMSDEIATNFGPVVIELRVPAGARAINVHSLKMSHEREQEIILGRGNKWRILSIESVTDPHHRAGAKKVVMELIEESRP